MGKLTVHETSTASWHALVKEAVRANQHTLDEELECYLIRTLERFTQAKALHKTIVGLDYLSALEGNSVVEIESMREVGDKCLLVSGLFPGHAERRRVRVEYYVALGKSAYYSISEGSSRLLAPLYRALSDEFVVLMDTLQSMRDIDSQLPSLTPLQAQALWVDTQSQHAKRLLKLFTKGQWQASSYFFDDKNLH